MSASSYGPEYPNTAHLLSLIGGILIVLDGFLTIIAGLLLSAFIGSDIPGASAAVAFVVGFGLLGVIFGFLIVFWAYRLKSNPGSARMLGILIIVFSLIGFLGGGGFYIGSILALIGGIMAVSWHPPVVYQPVYGRAGLRRAIRSTRRGTPVEPSRRPSAAARCRSAVLLIVRDSQRRVSSVLREVRRPDGLGATFENPFRPAGHALGFVCVPEKGYLGGGQPALTRCTGACGSARTTGGTRRSPILQPRSTFVRSGRCWRRRASRWSMPG